MEKTLVSRLRGVLALFVDVDGELLFDGKPASDLFEEDDRFSRKELRAAVGREATIEERPRAAIDVVAAMRDGYSCAAIAESLRILLPIVERRECEAVRRAEEAEFEARRPALLSELAALGGKAFDRASATWIARLVEEAKQTKLHQCERLLRSLNQFRKGLKQAPEEIGVSIESSGTAIAERWTQIDAAERVAARDASIHDDHAQRTAANVRENERKLGIRPAIRRPRVERPVEDGDGTSSWVVEELRRNDGRRRRAG